MNIQVIELRADDTGVLDRSPVALTLGEPHTVSHALGRLGYSPAEVNEMLTKRAVAVFGLYATAETALCEGDRLEILDGLRFDPKDSRRRRAEHKAASVPGKPQRRSRKQGA
ncbi:MAG TPA: RnfH family protein [Limnobacter sp.]|nr:RnfH family protein [Limnobacter sp.]